MSATETENTMRTAREWAKALVAYRQPSAARGIFELVVTFPPFVAVWTTMLLASSHGLFLLSFALAPLAAGLLIRLFLIQHDCGHGSFFPNKHANDWVGRALGVLTVTPYDLWRRTHAIYHASSGNLDRRGIGDIKTLTVREYFARDWRGRLCYRLYRHPAGDVRGRAGLYVPDREPAAVRLHGQGARCRGSARCPPTLGSRWPPVS